MKAISICGPWWWYILMGVKPVENRDWKHSYRGPLLIQVSQRILEADRVTAQQMAKQAGWGGSVPSPAELREACGKIVGMVQMVDAVETHPSPFFQGRYGHVYTSPVLFREWKAYPGQLGIFDVEEAFVPAAAGGQRVAGAQSLDFASGAAAGAPLPELSSNPLQRRMF